MSLEGNKAVAKRFIEIIGTLNAEEIGAMMHESAVFHTMFQSKGIPLVREQTKAQFCEVVGKHAKSIFPNGVRHEVRGMIAEGDYVALESECFATVIGERTYNNTFHFLIKIVDGKIETVKEYTDFLYVLETLFPENSEVVS